MRELRDSTRQFCDFLKYVKKLKMKEEFRDIVILLNVVVLFKYVNHGAWV